MELKETQVVGYNIGGREHILTLAKHMVEMIGRTRGRGYYEKRETKKKEERESTFFPLIMGGGLAAFMQNISQKILL